MGFWGSLGGAMGLGAFARGGGNTGVAGNRAEVNATRGLPPPVFSTSSGESPNLFDPATGMVGGQAAVPQGPPGQPQLADALAAQRAAAGPWQHPAEVMAQHLAASQQTPFGQHQPMMDAQWGAYRGPGMLPLGFFGRGPGSWGGPASGSWGGPARGLGYNPTGSAWSPPTPGLLGARY